MAGVNKVILIGNVGKDPDIISFESGRKATFPLATSEKYKDREGKPVEKTEWHNIVFWGPVVDVIEKYVKKGKQVFIEGKLATRSYEKDGQTRYITEVIGQNLTLLGSGLGGGNTSNTENTSSNSQEDNTPYVPPTVESSPSDDLPF
ncbi:single-stranded DNA-binding protein [Raineya orbicola]|uniref:Single-stranded DNA-binding protein n=1 Tax=Raineya orbicola TaxID=2016530 RepID=A0A2N3IJ03_9BACT|nr:single-stranded DNA-binding protein [Raineya orbicola]PKQ70294.1 ssb: single-stranded DNA-binding protein [Raineya orbicola]